MSTSAPHPPIPRQPIGATFVVAISILGIFAVIQFLAIVAYYYPKIREQVANAAAQSQQAAIPTPAPVAPAANASAQNPVQQGLSLADAQRAKKLAEETDRNSRVGDFESAFKSVQEWEELQPDDPSMLQWKAVVLEQLSQPAEAIRVWEQFLEIPGLSAENRKQVDKKIDLLAQTVHNARGGSRIAPATAVNSEGEDVPEPGIQAGKTMGISEVKTVTPEGTNTKHLRVAVKARQGVKVDSRSVRITCKLYDFGEDGNPVLTDSKVMPQWIGRPIDWLDDEPEILDVALGEKYYGYVVGVYYNGELQVVRAEPGVLASKFPVPDILKEDGNE